MPLQHEEPFYRSRTDEERARDKSKVFTIRFNRDELRQLEEAGRLLRQEQLSTLVKQLAEIGRRRVLHDPSVAYLIDEVFNNERRNHRRGITIPDPKFSQM